LALVEVEIVFNEAPDFLLDLLGPAELSHLVEVPRHDLLGVDELGMLEGEPSDDGLKVLLLQLAEFLAVLGH